jgi:imidazolonepropionase-like amidohydrolase
MALEMITRHAADALGLGEKVGSLSPAKFADMQCVQMNVDADGANVIAELVTRAPAPVQIWMSGAPLLQPLA